MTESVECSMCGRDGGPFGACSLCHGRGGIQSRQHTLSDEQSGRVKTPSRYGDDGKVGPHTTDPLWGGAEQ